MSKAFISILGTNDYLESYHYLNGEKISNTPSKYVQEDLVEYFCKNWESDSEIRIFLTEEAREKNWLDNGHIDRQSKLPKENPGLLNRLRKLNYKASIKDFDIPDGNTEEDLWQIFEIIFETFKENDEVIIDITHSFRFLPLLLTVMLNYTKQIRRIKILGVYYAAFESLGPIPEVAKWDVSKRKTPIFDLTPLVKLQEWTLATYDMGALSK
jgi:CRISPR-associated Csx2 family protein